MKKVLKGEKLVGVFDYLNEVPTVLNIKNKATSPEDYTDIAQIDETFKVISSFCIISTTKMINDTKASKKEITNEIHALDIVKMA